MINILKSDKLIFSGNSFIYNDDKSFKIYEYFLHSFNQSIFICYWIFQFCQTNKKVMVWEDFLTRKKSSIFLKLKNIEFQEEKDQMSYWQMFFFLVVVVIVILNLQFNPFMYVWTVLKILINNNSKQTFSLSVYQDIYICISPTIPNGWYW